jgi:hypothetical protein
MINIWNMHSLQINSVTVSQELKRMFKRLKKANEGLTYTIN